MKKILYLHGLESGQGGKKVDLLSANNLVYAPEIDYHNFTAVDFGKLLHEVWDFDIVIGSSAGGWLADMIASHTGADAVIFNPALHSRSFEVDSNIRRGRSYYDCVIVLGMEDEVIDPKLTKAYAANDDTIVEIEGMGHRTPLSVFTDIYYKYVN